jgi:dienelactone hydrolase
VRSTTYVVAREDGEAHVSFSCMRWLVLYPGDRHLFADNSLPDYDKNAAALLTERVLGFLDNIE